MPTYVFKDENGVHEEIFMSSEELGRRQFSVEDAPGQYLVHDRRILQRVYVPVGGQLPSCWPLKSKAAGVAVSQIKEQTEYDRSVGVPTEYCPRSGDAIYRDATHRRKHLKHHGLIDKSSFI